MGVKFSISLAAYVITTINYCLQPRTRPIGILAAIVLLIKKTLPTWTLGLMVISGIYNLAAMIYEDYHEPKENEVTV